MIKRFHENQNDNFEKMLNDQRFPKYYNTSYCVMGERILR